MMIEAVGGSALGGDRDWGRGLRSPVVGMRRVIGRVKVGRGRGERKGRQVGQFERFLFSAEGSVNGMRGGLFTVISILRGVCYGRIVSSGRGRVAHLRVTDDKPGSRLPLFPRQLSCLASVCIDNSPLVSESPTLFLSLGQSSHPWSFLPPNQSIHPIWLYAQPHLPCLGILGHPLGETAGLENSLCLPYQSFFPEATSCPSCVISGCGVTSLVHRTQLSGTGDRRPIEYSCRPLVESV